MATETTIADLEATFDGFLWHSPEHGDVSGSDFGLEDGVLSLHLWVVDSRDPDGPRRPITFAGDVDPHQSARDQIRNLIAEAITHELDEQLDFDGERPFYPHHPDADDCECRACLDAR